MNSKIDSFFKIISRDSFDKINYDYIYRELICYNNRKLEDSVIDILRIFSDMMSNDYDYIKIDNDCILISNAFNSGNTSRCVRLGIFNKLDYVIYNIQNDLNSSSVYALRMLVNDDGKNKLVSISDSIEKRKVFSIVDKMIRSR